MNAPIWRRRLTTAGIVVAALAVALVRTVNYSGELAPEVFWARKALLRHELDVVVAGDSRIFRGVDPEALRRCFPGARIANFGFSSAAYDDIYLTAVVSTLDPSSQHPTILVGVTPNSLLPDSAARNEFLELAAVPRADLYLQAWTGQALHRFRSFLFDTPDYKQVYHTSGWVASDNLQGNPRSSLFAYAVRLQKEHVHARYVAQLAAAVRQWHARGIRVIAFRPPCGSEMRALEDRSSGYDEVAISTALREAGAEWLTFEDRYFSYDGSHLREDGARQFSEDLATKVCSSTL